MNILIIDDEIDILESIKNILKPTNYYCKVTTSPIEGFSLVKKSSFDIVITDIKMDEKSGVDLIKEIRNINKNIKIIVISAFCDSDTVHSLLNEQIYSFFMKPLNIKEFINKLREIEKKINDEKNRHSELYKNKNFNFLNKEEK